MTQSILNIFHGLMITTLFSQLVILVVPLVFLLIYHHKTNPSLKYFYWGIAVSLLTAVKFVLLSSSILILSIFVFVITESVVRIVFVRISKGKAFHDVVFMLMGYIFTKYLALSLVNLFSVITQFSVISVSAAAKLELINQFSTLSYYIITIINSIHIYFYILMVFSFLLWKIKYTKNKYFLETACIVMSAVYLITHYTIMSVKADIVLMAGWGVFLFFASVLLSIKCLKEISGAKPE